MKMVSLSKIKFRLKNTKAQALLLVMVISMFSMALVLGVVDRTNKQLIIQRQNAEYQIGFTNATTAIAGLKALIEKGDVVPNKTTNDQINTLLNGGLLPGISSSDYKINVLPFDSAKDLTSPVLSDKGLLVEQFDKSNRTTYTSIDAVDKVQVFCPTSLTDLSVYVQFVYRDSSDKIKMENITTSCQGTNGGADWAAPLTDIEGTGISVSRNSDFIGSNTFTRLDYSIINNSKQKILYVKVDPKASFGSVNNNSIPLLVKLYNGSTLLGSSIPVQGTAIGYGKNGRNSTIYFTISNIPQQQPFFDYVMFEGS